MNYREKIISLAAWPALQARLVQPVVFTNGVFDILHPGHVEYLAQARAQGGALVVGLNSDRSVRMLNKGADRPINPQQDRALMLASLESVSAVIIFNESTPVELLAQLRPQLYVKGGDYDIETLAETALVRSWGGQALAIDFLPGYSTTKLLTRIRTC